MEGPSHYHKCQHAAKSVASLAYYDVVVPMGAARMSAALTP